MGFSEVTASSLVKIDVDGNVLDPGSVAGAVNLAIPSTPLTAHAAQSEHSWDTFD